MVLHKVHVLDGPEGLLRVVLVIGLDIAHPQQSDAGIVAVAVQLVQVRAADHDLVPGYQLRRGGHTGEIHRAFAAAAQLIGSVPQHDQLKGPGIFPGLRRVIGVPLGRGGAGKRLHLPYDRIIQLHQNLISTFLRSKILLTCT